MESVTCLCKEKMARNIPSPGGERHRCPFICGHKCTNINGWRDTGCPDRTGFDGQLYGMASLFLKEVHKVSNVGNIRDKAKKQLKVFKNARSGGGSRSENGSGFYQLFRENV